MTAHIWLGPARGEDQIAAICGCEHNDKGECVKHQPRPWDRRQKGCPLVDAMLHTDKHRRVS